MTKVHPPCGFCPAYVIHPIMPIALLLSCHFSMEIVTESEPAAALGFPTATPILDMLSPLPKREPAGLTTGDYFFVSSAIILAFTELPLLRQFLQALSRRSAMVFWMGILGLPLIAFAAAIAVHIAGHLLAARFTAFDAVRIKFGRLMFRNQLESEDVLSLGFMVMRPRSCERLRLRLSWLIVAGPLASLIVPLAAEMVLRFVQHRVPGNLLLLPAGIHLFAALSLLGGIGALLPDIDSSGNFSDGTRLLMLVKNDFRASRVLAMLELQLLLNSEKQLVLHRQDLIDRIALPHDESFDTVVANWLAYLWASRCQDLAAATKFLETAIALLGPSPGHLRDRIFLEAAFFQSWYRHNFVKARFWESQIADLNALALFERKRLEIAFCWSEGKSFEAWEKLGAHLRWLSELPASPARITAERDAQEWKAQMESRLLSGAWATMHSWPYERQIQPVM